MTQPEAGDDRGDLPRRGRRDRHGRGLRGPLAPASSPASVDRTERFGDLVASAVDRLEPRWGRRLRAVDVEILDAPPVSAADLSAVPLMDVPLAAHRRSRDGEEATIVVYRRPVELRAPDRPARVELVRDLVAEQLGAVLGVPPHELDPSYVDPDDD